MKRTLWIIGANMAVSAVLLLAGCSRAGELPISLPEGAQAGDLVGLHECMFEAGDKEYIADCGTLVVPENRGNPGARLIALPVIRVQALGDNPSEPVFWLAGGPGGSNMHFTGLQGLIENHDIIMVGYRGMDGTVVLECPEMARAAKGVGGDFLSEPSLSNFGKAMTLCAKRLQEEGIDLDGYSIPEVVEDLEDARAALRYQRVNLLSGSYGTRVAMFYAWMYPDSLYRSAMIAVNPPGHFVWEPRVIDAQIAYDAKLCAQDSECSARTPDLAETVRNISHNIPESWLLIPIDPGKVRFITHFMLFHRGTAATVFDSYLAAEGGDPSGLALMSLAHNFMIPSTVTWGDWAAKGSSDYDPARDWLTDMDPPNSILGSPTSLLVGAATQLGGGLMTLLMIYTFTRWASQRDRLSEQHRISSDYRMAGYFFFGMATYTLCPLLGFKTFALSPEKMIQYGLQAEAASFAFHILLELVLGWAFTALGFRKSLSYD